MPTRLTAKGALIGAAGGVALLAITWFAAFHVALAMRADQSILHGFYQLSDHGRIDSLARSVANTCNPHPYVYFAWVPVAIALLRRRPGIAIAITAILIGASETTQLLKPLLAHPRPFAEKDDPFLGSWPSGHATAAMAFALCLVLAVPARLRPVVATVGAAFVVAVCYSFLALGWHYPSDVLGGFLVATTWTLLAISALLAVERRRMAATASAPRLSVRGALGPPGAALLLALVLAVAVVLVRPHEVVTYARAHEAFMIGAPLIALIALALATGVMLAVRR
jgi:membrane-associated phospholipid phosphatase